MQVHGCRAGRPSHDPGFLQNEPNRDQRGEEGHPGAQESVTRRPQPGLFRTLE